MPHLDEGILSALLDGELSGAEQQEIDAHLRTCAECRDRLAELKGFMQVADQLVTALDEVPAQSTPSQPARRRDYRALAWAASIVLAVGLGFAGRSLLLNDRRPTTSAARDEVGNLVAEPRPMAPDSPASTDREQVAIGSPSAQAESERRVNQSPNQTPALERRSGVSSAPSSELSVRGGRTDESATSVDGVPVKPGYRGTGFRTDSAGRIASNAVEAPSADSSRADGPGRQDVASGAGVPAPADRLRDSIAPESQVQGQLGIADKDATALGTRERENAAQAQSPPAALFQPRNEVSTYNPLNLTGTRVIPMEEAVRVLGGSIRLVDSLTPVRMELMGADSTIRVVYHTGGVELWLDQRRDRGGAVARRSLAAPMERKSVYVSNQLSWNDLQGFYLTLTGPLPVAALVQIKARIH
ncbi:MAG TPA: zf-HC2 domain-containing protein [Gemmatimonadales bacterium]|nr:zf-HC2 domain-containing protein [Gemmatimonadales bacterium]